MQFMKDQALSQVGPEGGGETAVVELQCSQSPGCPAFLIVAHFLPDGGEVMIFMLIPMCLSTLFITSSLNIGQ